MNARTVAIYFALIVAVFGIRVYWQHGMPDDSENVCTFNGKGYVVSNGLTGVFLHRRAELDAQCARIMK